jgi:hypothetical protein
MGYLANVARKGELIKAKLELKPSATRDIGNLGLSYPRFAVVPSPTPA